MCYQSMFWGCTSLITAPKLTATTLAYGCYYGMFYNCTSLVQAPELPATTLEKYCYSSMFYNCKNLNYIKAMFITDKNLSLNYLGSWLNGVSSTGTFIKSKDATWSNTNAEIPTGWTVETV